MRTLHALTEYVELNGSGAFVDELRLPVVLDSMQNANTGFPSATACSYSSSVIDLGDRPSTVGSKP